MQHSEKIIIAPREQFDRVADKNLCRLPYKEAVLGVFYRGNVSS